MVRCEVVDRDHRTPLTGAYLPPTTLYHLSDLEEVLNRLPGRDPIILGDLNAYIGLLRNPRDEQVSDLLASFGLVDFFCNL